MVEAINDHLTDNLKILFIGFNPSIKSGTVGHHYANPNNRFYKILHQAGFTSRKYKPEEDRALLQIGYGLTNIVERPTKAASDITREEYNEGRKILRKKIETYKPKIACFVGKGVYQEYSQRRSIKWGAQEKEIVPGVIDFVAPSSSGLVRMNLDEIVSIYKEMHYLLK